MKNREIWGEVEGKEEGRGGGRTGREGTETEVFSVPQTCHTHYSYLKLSGKIVS